ncbi:hypothetical protein [Flavobacterium lipolyticum]|uniref:Leucine-rich repeat domain-containing protein n=1 Tax=Flavobacterium lipolyticum TaxID=2893754 RepID=A0ABS8M7G1_9FLAO|nr:hypothetical protein [Flavobacterium sp. F-126]MCC9020629.1 hypothetical protein [Flavobacterium sp. F-126]
MYTEVKKAIINSNSKNWYFSIEKQDFGGNVEYRQYLDFPNEDEYLDIKSITFSITSNDEERITKYPEFIGKLLNLKSLIIPIDWLDKIEIPANIEVLKLNSPVSNFDSQHELPNNLILNNLKYLSISELAKPCLFNVVSFPNIEWIDYDLAPEKNTNRIFELSKLSNLRHLIFGHAKNLDVFPYFINHKIETLELFACIGKNFPIEKIVHFKTLKSLYINNISVVFDCNILLELEELEELYLLNIKNVINVEKILEHNKINRISIKACGNPFKKIGKNSFFEKGYSSLAIDYA